MTTLGMKEEQMGQIGIMLHDLLKGCTPAHDPKTGKKSRVKVEIDPQVLSRVQLKVKDLLADFPLYPELVIS